MTPRDAPRPAGLAAARLRPWLVALLLWPAGQPAIACSCFPPELRAKVGQDALQQARIAVFGRIVEVTADGRATLRVLESFKGPAVGALVEVAPDPAQCPVTVPAPAPGDEALVLSFGDAVTSCDRQPPDHFLLEVFRAGAVR